jgi:pimeloyl-ACP methyl ester carboxylesterase
MTAVAFVHGWGFGPEIWDAVRARLDGLPSRCLDLGFFGPADTDPGEAALIVGHSLGSLWCLLEHPGRRLLSVNGFPRFTAGDGFPDGVPPRLVAHMRRRLDTAPQAVLDAFRARCGGGPADRPGAPQRLAWGLDLLAEGDARAAPPPIGALAGADDPIVPAAMRRASWPDVLRVVDGGHLLPLTAPEAVAAAIRLALETA